MTESAPKPPDGYREIVSPEKERFFNVGNAIVLLQFKLGQQAAELKAARAEVELTQLRIRESQREMQIALKQRDEHNLEMRIGYGKEDVIVDGTRVYVVVRPDGWEPPKGGVHGGSEAKLVPGFGLVEVTKVPGVLPSEDGKK
ncbi:MAG: hypothetical protein ACRD1P_11530 [Thermoanaerobaculia bacterium]